MVRRNARHEGERDKRLQGRPTAIEVRVRKMNAQGCPGATLPWHSASTGRASTEGWGALMYARLFSTIAVVASFAVASALAEEGPKPTQSLLSPSWVGAFQRRVWVREMYAHMLEKMRHYFAGRDDFLLKNMRNLADGEGQLRIRFVLNRAGHIVSAKAEKSSGNVVLDNAMLAAVRHGDPVPLPPPSLTDQQLIVHLPVIFRDFRPSSRSDLPSGRN
jgi:TonB family protein